jgi:hypothetical protein
MCELEFLIVNFKKLIRTFTVSLFLMVHLEIIVF